ncbi:hypothetical protein B7O87_01130 [Cylindrospermopsis raciborskii CENA303]|uniref:Spore protein YkvP/CgeB glycosyl transferase-like domain-containing protein n=1 Tax=Cylindrospermopsis raciborskii CENA303 TaxID=1170769 RepID=A0A1X4GIU0_9CYAN|nr:glycosyltransferase [Cylindrospermopsis raciborskii]OSO97112.1 hypothetical protein B7O87_01130 [Cylindrospermopsis raciborskii CENA303]
MGKFKILRISQLAYPKALIVFESKHPEVQILPYEEQKRLFFSEKLVYSDSFSRAMRQLGHEADEIVSDVDWIQKTWAKENSVNYSDSSWQEEILLSQISKIRPEILYFQHNPPLPYGVWKNLKHTCPSIKKILVHRAFPGNFNTLGAADLLMVGTRRLVSQYADHDIKAKLLYHYFDEAVPDLLDRPQIKYPLTFLGSSGFSYGISHATRYWLLRTVLEQTQAKMWLEEPLSISPNANPTQQVKKLLSSIIKGFVNFLPRTSQKSLGNAAWLPLKARNLIQSEYEQIELRPTGLKVPEKRLLDLFPQRCHSPVYGLDYYEIIANSLISFNCHTDAAVDQVGNMRMFQATGMGSCLLTDTGDNMSDLFEEDKEVVTYSSKEEALEKIDYLLQNETKCREIASAGQNRTLRDHTALKRCEQIDEWLQEIMMC